MSNEIEDKNSSNSQPNEQNNQPTSLEDGSASKLPKPKNTFGFYFNVFFQVIRSLLTTMIVLFLLIGVLVFGIGMGYFAFLVSDSPIPSKNELKDQINDVEQVSYLTYDDGEHIADVRADLLRTNVQSKDISPWVKKALIATEDEYFDVHPGIVPKALIRGVIADATGLGGRSGGSTLTQQLVKQQVLTSETTYKRKANELLYALRVEKYFSKDEIITAYLNVSPFGRNNKGQNIAGVEEAAKGIFGKNANDLSLPQAAFIAGLPQSPIVYSPYQNTGELKTDLTYGLKRKDNVLFNMYKENYITQKEYQTALAYDLKQDFRPQEALSNNQNDFLYYFIHNQAVEALMPSYFEKDGLTADEVYQSVTLYNKYYKVTERELRRNGYTVQSTINKNIYNAMQQAMLNYAPQLEDGTGQVTEVGNVAIENKTGKIIGFVAGRNYALNQNNHAFQTRRSPGSTMKPIIAYGPAIDNGLIGSESKLSDFPKNYLTNGKPVTNYGGKSGNSFKSARKALENSDNIPVINLYEKLIETVNPATYFEKMNIKLAPEQYFNESMPLGTADLTVFEQTNAFATLANGGVYQAGYAIEKITDNNGQVIYQHEAKPVEVYSPATASIMEDMMRGVLNEGTGKKAKESLAALDGTLANADWAGKTGTSEDDKDFWFTASTPTITVSSWIGHDDNTRMPATFTYTNMGYWAYIVNAIYQNQPGLIGADLKFNLDASVIKAKVSDFSGQKMGTLFLNGAKRNVPGKEIESLYAKNGPEETKFKFAIGGSEENYQAAWNNASQIDDKNKKEEEKKKQDEKKKETEEKEEKEEKKKETNTP